jgi:hypothetical protein
MQRSIKNYQYSVVSLSCLSRRTALLHGVAGACLILAGAAPGHPRHPEAGAQQASKEPSTERAAASGRCGSSKPRIPIERIGVALSRHLP